MKGWQDLKEARWTITCWLDNLFLDIPQCGYHAHHVKYYAVSVNYITSSLFLFLFIPLKLESILCTVKCGN